MTDGTTLMSVISSFAGREPSSRAFAAKMSLPPALRVTNISHMETSKHTEVENNTPESSRAVRISCAQ